MKTAVGPAAEKKIDAWFAERKRPRYHGELPPGNDGLGLGLLGISGDRLVDAATYAGFARQRWPVCVARCRPIF